jgi:hypothetical protein
VSLDLTGIVRVRQYRTVEEAAARELLSATKPVVAVPACTHWSSLDDRT